MNSRTHWCHGDRREERQREADQPVRPHLQQNARQDDRAGGWRFHVGIGQPGVEWEHRYLDGEADKECEEQPDGRVPADLRRRRVQIRQVKRVHAGQSVVMEVQEQDAQQHQHRAEQRVQEELDGRVQLARAAPDADQQVHRHQHGFPEDEEQEHVVGHEDPEHARLQYQEPDVIFFDAVLNGVPRRQDRNGPQQGGQHDQQERNAVDADHVTRANGRDPIVG